MNDNDGDSAGKPPTRPETRCVFCGASTGAVSYAPPLRTGKTCFVRHKRTYKVSQGFHGSTHADSLSHAYDFTCPSGTPVYAARRGTVIDYATHFRNTPSVLDRQRANFVVVRHEDDTYARYFHLKKALARVGDRVDRSTIVGLSGNSGFSTGPHLHFDVVDVYPKECFEVRLNDVPVNDQLTIEDEKDEKRDSLVECSVANFSAVPPSDECVEIKDVRVTARDGKRSFRQLTQDAIENRESTKDPVLIVIVNSAKDEHLLPFFGDQKDQTPYENVFVILVSHSAKHVASSSTAARVRWSPHFHVRGDRHDYEGNACAFNKPITLPFQMEGVEDLVIERTPKLERRPTWLRGT